MVYVFMHHTNTKHNKMSIMGAHGVLLKSPCQLEYNETRSGISGGLYTWFRLYASLVSAVQNARSNITVLLSRPYFYNTFTKHSVYQTSCPLVADFFTAYHDEIFLSISHHGTPMVPK